MSLKNQFLRAHRGPMPPQFKSNNLLNKHFFQLIKFYVKRIMSGENWQGGLLLEIGTIDGS